MLLSEACKEEVLTGQLQKGGYIKQPGSIQTAIHITAVALTTR